MTDEEVIRLLRIEHACSQANCDRKCDRCEIVQEQSTLDEMYKRAIQLVEENEKLKFLLDIDNNEIMQENLKLTEENNELRVLVKKLADEKIEVMQEREIASFESWNNRLTDLVLENAKLKTICDFNCPIHKLATHNACLICPAVRNSPHHDLKNVTDEELQKIIKDTEAEMEM